MENRGVTMNYDDGMNHIQRMSQRYRILFNVLIISIPALDFLYWVFFNHLPEGFVATLPVLRSYPLSSPFLALAFLASLLPVSAALYGVMTLRALFSLYEKAIIFSAENVMYFRRLGYALIAWVISNALFTPLISAIMTYSNPPGDRMLVAQLGVFDISTLLIGCVVLLIAWVMDEGRKLEDEQAHTV